MDISFDKFQVKILIFKYYAQIMYSALSIVNCLLDHSRSIVKETAHGDVATIGTSLSMLLPVSPSEQAL